MTVPAVKRLLKILPPFRDAECTVILPPVSKELEIPSWNELFQKFDQNNVRINVSNYGCLLDIKDDEIQYIVMSQTDGVEEHIIVSGYEKIGGNNQCVGSIAFEGSPDGDCFFLQDIPSVSIEIDNQHFDYQEPSKKIKKQFSNWKPLTIIHEVAGINSFLGTNVISFGKEEFIFRSTRADALSTSEKVRPVLLSHRPVSLEEMCSLYIGEKNLYNISLSDLVYVANIVNRNKGYKPALLETGNLYKLGTYKRFAPMVDVNLIPSIPANFPTITWKIRDKKKQILKFEKIDRNKHSDQQIIESIVNHFDHCSTETVANELLYFYVKDVDPSAFFAAKTFLLMCQVDNIEIDSCNEIISTPIQDDDSEYIEIDKTQIPLMQEKMKPKPEKNSIWKNR